MPSLLYYPVEVQQRIKCSSETSFPQSTLRVPLEKFDDKPILTDTVLGVEDDRCYLGFTSRSPKLRGRCGELYRTSNARARS